MESVPPHLYGSTERIVAYLTHSLRGDSKHLRMLQREGMAVKQKKSSPSVIPFLRFAQPATEASDQAARPLEDGRR